MELQKSCSKKSKFEIGSLKTCSETEKILENSWKSCKNCWHSQKTSSINPWKNLQKPVICQILKKMLEKSWTDATWYFKKVVLNNLSLKLDLEKTFKNWCHLSKIVQKPFKIWESQKQKLKTDLKNHQKSFKNLSKSENRRSKSQKSGQKKLLRYHVIVGLEKVTNAEFENRSEKKGGSKIIKKTPKS